MEENVNNQDKKFFDFGDLYFQCHNCGNLELLGKGIKDGLQFILQTSDKDEWKMTCHKCQNTMRIFFKESDEETKKEAQAKLDEEMRLRKEQAEKDAVEKAKKELENGTKEESKKEKSTKRSSKRSKRTTGTDGEGEAVTATLDQA